jgi:uncharacterized membrane protein YkgB
MEMIESIKQYYHSERSMGFIAAGIGLAFLIIGWIVYRQYGIEQLNRGLVYTLVVGGLFFLTALGFAFQNSKKMAEVNSYTQTNTELKRNEIQRVEKVLATGYRVSSILSSILVITGLALILLNPGNLFRGIGMGILIFGTAMHTIDFFSINKHKIYYETIKELKY